MPDPWVDPGTGMNRLQLKAGLWVSIVSLLVLFLRVALPDRVTLDQGTQVVLVIAALPWLALFFKKITIPGVVDVETRDREQGVAASPTPAATRAPAAALPADQPAPAAPSAPAKKILATLGRYQGQFFRHDPTRRWTFRVHPSSPDFAAFLSGVGEAVKAGWVAVSPLTHHCMLTNEGLAYVENHAEIRDSRDFYPF